MGAYGDEIERAWRIVAERMGAVAKFRPKNGDTDIDGVSVIPLLAVQAQTFGIAETWGPVDTIEYWLSDVGREAAIGDIFEIGAATWVVKGIIGSNGYTVQVAAGRM